MNLDDIFNGARVPPWLRDFEDAPEKAVSDLLVGRADMETLSAEEPFMLLLDWLSAIGEKDGGFVGKVDKALVAWIENSWGNPTLAEAGQSASLTSVAWRQAADIIAMREDLDKSAECLQQKVINEPDFLNALHEGRGRDPMASAWRAIARYQKNQSLDKQQSLVKQWWRLCSLPPNEPWYRGVCGIYGLRNLPSSTGDFKNEVAEGLAMLAEGFWRYQKEGWLQSDFAEKEFLRTARMTMAAYPFPKKWQSFWGDVVTREKFTELRDWIGKIASLTSGASLKKKSEKSSKQQWNQQDPQWAKRAQDIAQKLRGATLDSAINDAINLLWEEEKYAKATGNTDDIVRTACNFAGKIRPYRPNLSYEWAALARDFNPWNPYTWTISTKTLLELNKHQEAFLLSLQALRRFPDNVVARNGLAEVLKAQNRLNEAKVLYRETIERFPNDVISRTGFAEVLKTQNKLDEAEAVYRETIERFPDNVISRTGFAEVLKTQNKLDEAEAVYRETIERFPDNVISRTGFAEVLKTQNNLDEAEAVYRETIERFPDNVFARNGLAEVLKAQNNLDEAEAVYRETIERFPDNVVARNGLAEVLKAQNKLDEAEAVYRETIERFPDNVVARNGLAEVLKAQNNLDEAEAVYRETIERFPDNVFARTGLAEVLKAQEQSSAPLSTPEEENNFPTPASAMTKTGKGHEERDIHSHDIEVLLADAYVLRRWQLNLNPENDLPDTGEIRTKARNLLNNLKPFINKNARVATEAGLLNLKLSMTQEEIEQAVELLTVASERFRGSIRIQYALAHARRQLAQSNTDSLPESEIIAPWRRLSRTNPHCRPIEHLGKGRTWLALKNGNADDGKAKDAFGRLAKWTSQRIQLSDNGAVLDTHNANSLENLRQRITPHNGTDNFSFWLAQSVQIHVFGESKISRADDINDLGAIRQRTKRYSNILDQIEEECITRFD